MNIQEIGQTLLSELQTKLAEDQNNAKLAEGAIQGVQLFYNRIIQAQQAESNNVSSENTKSVSKGKKAKK